jgi:hypothetical protein
MVNLSVVSLSPLKTIVWQAGLDGLNLTIL